ncbi:hypothetical protein K4F52_007282 [Lecanicillium sp. MT-2017a]|nr:hypothetical protein K4F52_007282 [Lecanicillium sp. MT-2017a]
MSESSPLGPGSSKPNARRGKEDREVLKARLVDSHFNMNRYPDPLADRPSPDPKFYPAGISPEMERQWLAIIESAKKH